MPGRKLTEDTTMLGPQFSSILIATLIATLLFAVSARAAVEKLPREPQQANPGAPVGTGIGVVCTTIVAPSPLAQAIRSARALNRWELGPWHGTAVMSYLTYTQQTC